MHASLLENFPDIRDSSVIGVGDIEMTRDQHTVFPGSTGGYVDWYIATTRQLQTATYEFTHFRKTAELSDQSQYIIDLVEDQFPCLYWVSDIVDEATNELCFIYEQRKYLAEGDADSPRIHENEEAMFTAYQLTEVAFLGPHDLQSIKVSGTYMPQIKEIQDWVLRCGQAPVGLDVLVRGATPVTLQFSAVLSTPIGSAVDFTLLQGRVADYINAIPFDGVLAVSGLVALLHSSLPAGSFVSEPALFASLWLSPIPTVFGVTDRLVLDQFLFGTNRTSILYCDAADVSFKHKFIDARC